MVEQALRHGVFERPEYLQEPEPVQHERRFDVRRSLPGRLMNLAPVRQASLLVALAVAWELYALSLDNDLVLPSFVETAGAFWHGIVAGPLLLRALTSLQVLLTGYAVALLLAFAFTLFAIASRIGADLLTLLTAMFNPLPAVALLPLALLWFGLGEKSIVFVLIHSVLWPLTLNVYTGFRSVGDTLRMSGHSFGLRGARFAWKILVPAAFPAILTGLKIGWAFGWRTLIAAELVFGVSSGSGGLGWFIYENRNELETANVFAGLLTLLIIGLAVESVIFGGIERVTVCRWGMQK